MAFDFTYTIGFLADMSSVKESIRVFSGDLTGNPLDLSTQLTGLDTTNAQKSLDAFKATGNEITGVTAKISTFKTKSGQVFREITGLVTTFNDAMGNAGSSVLKVVNNVEGLKSTEALFTRLNAKATEWSTRAEKMGAKDKEAIQKVAVQLQDAIIKYEKFINTGKLSKANSMIATITDLGKELERVGNESLRAAVGVRSWSTRMGDAIKQTIAYTFSYRLLREAMSLVNDAIKYNIELNKEMVKIQVLQVEGAQTPEQIQALAQSYNELARAMGATTMEVAKGSVEWLRQGKTIQETQELMEASMMLSKLGAMSSEEATQDLTSALNSFRLSSEDAIGVVDKLIAVDNIAATSAGELAVALRYVAAVGAESGVSLDQLISYIGVISSVTRLNAEQIGQSLKTIFTRMQDIRAGKIDEDGLGINNTALALQRVGIQLMENETEFRDFSTVLEEVAAKWDSLNEVEQANISKSIAGVRQANMFRILMQNMGQALRYQQEEASAAGLAMDRYQIYLQNVEAAQNKLRASFEGLVQSQAMQKTYIKLFDTLSGIIDVIEKIGGLTPILSVAVGLFIVFASVKMTLGIMKAATSVGDFAKMLTQLIPLLWAAIVGEGGLAASTAALAVEVAIATAGISLLVAGIVLFVKALIDGGDKADKTRESIANLKEELRTLKTNNKQVAELTKELEGLDRESERAIEITTRLKELLPTLKGSFDAYGNFILDTDVKIQDLVTSTLELIQAQEDLIESARNAGAKALGKDLGEAYAEWYKLIEKAGTDISDKEQEKIDAAKVAYLSLLNEAMPEFELMGADAQERFMDALLRVKWDKVDFHPLTDIFKNILGDIEAEKLTIALPKMEISEPLEPIVPIKTKLDTTSFVQMLIPVKEEMDKVYAIKQKLESEGILALSKEEVDLLEKLKLDIIETGDGYSTLSERSENMWKIMTRAASEASYEIPAGLQEIWDSVFEGADAAETAEEAFDRTKDSLSAMLSAMKEQADDGHISADTAMELLTAHKELAKYLEYTAEGFIFNAEAAREDIRTKIEAAIADYGLTTATEAATKGQYELALAFLRTADVIDNEAIAAIQQYIDALGALGAVGGGRGGAGAGGETASQKAQREALEALVDAAKDEKDRLKDQLDAYKEIINARKDLLKSYQEELDYKDELAEKEKNVSDLQRELAEISFDNSEEAQRKRLELQEKLAEAEHDLDKTQRDRAYDLQIEALDRELDAYEKFINAQIGMLDDFLDSLSDLIDKVKGGEAVSIPSMPKTGTYVYIPPANQTLEDAEKTFARGGYHEGLDRGFVGNVKSNEDFYKLLNGELVINPEQMSIFLSKVLPEIVMTGRGGDISLQMPITVQGNLDETVIPEIEVIAEKALDKIIRAMSERGYTRAVNQFSI